MSSQTTKKLTSEDGKMFIHSPGYEATKARLENLWRNDSKIVHFNSPTTFSGEFIFDLAKICCASILSDGSHQEEETVVAKEICKELNINWDEFSVILNNAIHLVQNSKYKDVYEYLRYSEFGKGTKNAMLLFEATLHIVLADGIMTDKEAKLLADVADILVISTDKVIGRIAQFLRFENDVVVDLAIREWVGTATLLLS